MSSDICPAWLSFALNNRMRRLIHNPQQIFGDFVKEGDIVADIGCGPGYFSLSLAEMVGDNGRVISIDIQKDMLDRVKKYARSIHLESRIMPHQCDENGLRIPQQLDFALAFWMVHEVPDSKSFFQEVAEALNPKGVLLLVEPKMHVSDNKFQDEVSQAINSGLKAKQMVKVNLSRGMLFIKG